MSRASHVTTGCIRASSHKPPFPNTAVTHASPHESSYGLVEIFFSFLAPNNVQYDTIFSFYIFYFRTQQLRFSFYILFHCNFPIIGHACVSRSFVCIDADASPHRCFTSRSHRNSYRTMSMSSRADRSPEIVFAIGADFFDFPRASRVTRQLWGRR